MDLKTLLTDLSSRAGQEFGAGTFQSRLRAQKAIFLLGCLGHSTAMPYRDTFGMYLRGPYSSSLTLDYFAVQNGTYIPPAITVGTSPHDAEALRTVIDAARQGNGFLEAVATLAKLRVDTPRLRETDLVRLGLTLKPHLEEILPAAARFVVQNIPA